MIDAYYSGLMDEWMDGFYTLYFWVHCITLSDYDNNTSNLLIKMINSYLYCTEMNMSYLKFTSCNLDNVSSICLQGRTEMLLFRHTPLFMMMIKSMMIPDFKDSQGLNSVVIHRLSTGCPGNESGFDSQSEIDT